MRILSRVQRGSAVLEELVGSNRPLVVSSGVLGLAQGRLGNEEDVPARAVPSKREATGLSFALNGVRASVIRLSPSVHGDGDHGFVPQPINSAGGRYHGVDEEGVAIRDIAEMIGKRLRVPAVSKSAEEVVRALGFIGQVLAMDAPSSSKLTQERLGWRPTQPGLLADLEQGTYFDAT